MSLVDRIDEKKPTSDQVEASMEGLTWSEEYFKKQRELYEEANRLTAKLARIVIAGASSIRAKYITDNITSAQNTSDILAHRDTLEGARRRSYYDLITFYDPSTNAETTIPGPVLMEYLNRDEFIKLIDVSELTEHTLSSAYFDGSIEEATPATKAALKLIFNPHIYLHNQPQPAPSSELLEELAPWERELLQAYQAVDSDDNQGDVNNGHSNDHEHPEPHHDS